MAPRIQISGGPDVGPVGCTLSWASDMDRPRPFRPAAASPSRAGAEPATPGAQFRSDGIAAAVPARVRWARRLLLLVVVLVLAVGVGSRMLDTLPVPPTHAPVAPSVLYDRYGTPIAEIGPSVPHASLGLEDMAPALVDAMVAVLDPSFFVRVGVDASAYADALRRAWGVAEGTPGGIMRRYLDAVHHERQGAVGEARMLLAELRLGRKLSRPEILERFMNIVYLGRGAYGVHAAAAAWYGVPASDLTVTQAAYLASLADAPWGVDGAPGVADDAVGAARERRDRVLVAMYEHGVLTSHELAAGRLEPLSAGLRPAAALGVTAADSTLEGEADGFARLLIDGIGLRASVGQAYIELAERYGIDRVVTGGLHVTTSVDVPAQRAAAEAVRRLFAATPGVRPVLSAEVTVTDRSGDVRVLLSAAAAGATGTVDVSSDAQRRPLGDLLGTAAQVFAAAARPAAAAQGVGAAAGAGQVAAAFGVIAADGEERAPRIVLEVGDAAPGPSSSRGDVERWPVQRTRILEAGAAAELRAGMETLVLPSGVTVLGRAGVSTATGDAWFAGSTSQYTAAARITSAAPVETSGAVQRARGLLVDVLHPLQYPR